MTKKGKGQTLIYKTLCKNLQTERTKPTKTHVELRYPGRASSSSETRSVTQKVAKEKNTQ